MVREVISGDFVIDVTRSLAIASST